LARGNRRPQKEKRSKKADPTEKAAENGFSYKPLASIGVKIAPYVKTLTYSRYVFPLADIRMRMFACEYSQQQCLFSLFFGFMLNL
jgi:hypothetical protein